MKKSREITGIVIILMFLGLVIFGYNLNEEERTKVIHIFVKPKKLTNSERPRIISRKERGADEKMTYKVRDTPTEEDTPPSEASQKRNNFMNKNYEKYIKKDKTKTTYREDSNELVRPIEHVSRIRAVTIHHTTDLGFNSDKENLDFILNLHGRKKGRGDIGYHFIIGLSGYIYEGRKGGETAIGAHMKSNNIQNVGISVIGDYRIDKINNLQYQSLDQLIRYLVQKYNIDTTKKQPFFEICNKTGCKDPVKVIYKYPILTHDDVRITECPGKNLHKEVQKIKEKIMDEQNNKK